MENILHRKYQFGIFYGLLSKVYVALWKKEKVASSRKERAWGWKLQEEERTEIWSLFFSRKTFGGHYFFIFGLCFEIYGPGHTFSELPLVWCLEWWDVCVSFDVTRKCWSALSYLANELDRITLLIDMKNVLAIKEPQLSHHHITMSSKL